MRFAWAMAFVLAVPQPAFALSCMPHSVEAAYIQADEAEVGYVVVQGRLSFDTDKLPKVDYERQHETPSLTRIPAILEGKSLSEDGFSFPFEAQVTLDVACFGPWCAQVPSRTDVLAFVERTEGGYVIATNPCGGFLFAEPTSALIRHVKACFAGQLCEPHKP